MVAAKRPDLNDLRALLEVARTGSFTGAAARLGLSQSALSQTIRRLEDGLGQRLLDRHTRRVEPTEAGHRLIEATRPALREIDIALDRVAEHQDEPAGHISLAFTRLSAANYLWPRLRDIASRYPRLRLELSVNEARIDLTHGIYDALVCYRQSLEPGLESRQLSDGLRTGVFATPDYLASHGTPQRPIDLLNHHCVNFRPAGRDSVAPWPFIVDGEEINISPPGNLILNDSELMARAGREGLGLIYTFYSAVEADLAAGRMVQVLDDFMPIQPDLHIIYHARRYTPALRLVIEQLVAHHTPENPVKEDLAGVR